MTFAVIGAADDVGVIILREANQILNTRARWNHRTALEQAHHVAKGTVRS